MSSLSRWVARGFTVTLGGVALTRATSYLTRPPMQTKSTELIESVIDYRTWGAILVIATGVACVGVVTKGSVSMWSYFAGHVVLFGAYSVFALSVLVGAICYQQSWTSLGEVVLVATLHSVRVLLVALDARTPERGR